MKVLVAQSSMEFSRQEYWSELPVPSPGGLPDPGTEPESHIAGRFFTVWATGSPDQKKGERNL